MEEIKQKIIQKSLKQNIYIPKSIRFNFKEFQELNGIEKMDFLLEKKMLSYNSHKLIEPQDLQQIFIEVNDYIQNEINKSTNQFQNDFYEILNKFNNFLTNLTEDKHYLYFQSFEPLVQVLEQCWNLDIIYITMEIMMNVFTIRNKYFQEIMLNLNQEAIFKFFFYTHVWFYGINFCNFNQFKAEEYFTQITIQDLQQFYVNINQVEFFNDFNLDKINEKNFFTMNQGFLFKINLEQYKKNQDLKQIIQEISQKQQINISENSLFAQVLKMRLIIYDSTINSNQQINKLNIQNVLYLNISSFLILHHSSKVQDILEMHNQIRVLINQQYFLDYSFFPIDVFKQAFLENQQEEYQIRSIVSMFNFYNSLEYNPEYYNLLENFLRKILQNTVNNLYQKQSGNNLAQKNQEYYVIPSDEFINQFIVIIWLFYEEDDERHSNSIQYSAVMDSVLRLINYYNIELTKSYNKNYVFNLAKIICMIKNEVHKDKEIVFLDVLLNLFDTHLTLYNKYRLQIKEFKNVLNCYGQFLFEIIEAMFFYILDPAKQKLIHQIPKISRDILEHKFWENQAYIDLTLKDQGFFQIFSMSVSLMNDLIYELPENLQPTLLKRFIDNKVIFLINENFLMKNIPCDFDVISFYLKLISNFHLHYPEDITEQNIKDIIERVFDLIFHKKMVCNNVKRFLSNYSNETLKNLAEDLVMLTNVHPKFTKFILSNLKNLNNKLKIFEDFARKIQINSQNLEDLKQNILNNNQCIKDYGWFNNSDIQSQEDLYDNFYLLQKHFQNIFKFQIKFFDHSKSNIFKNFFNEENLNDFEQFEILFNRGLIYINNITKFKKHSSLFFKLLIHTHNVFTIKRFKKYVIKNALSKNSYFDKALIYYSQCNRNEKQFIAQVLEKKNNDDGQIYDTNLECITENTYNFLNNLKIYFSIIECLKNVLTNEQIDGITQKQLIEKQTKNFVQKIQKFRKFQLEILIYQNQSLFQNNLEEIENLLLENYTVKIRINQSTLIDTILRRITFSELDFFEQIIYEVQEIFNRKYLSKINTNFNVPQREFIESYFIMDTMINSKEKIDLNQKMILYNKILASLSPLFLNKGQSDYFLKLSQIIYVLSQKKIFSNFMIQCLEDVFLYIKNSKKEIKKLLIKKQKNLHNLEMKDIQSLYKFDSNLKQVFIYIKMIVFNFFKENENLNIFDIESQNNNKYEAQQIIENEKFDFLIGITDLLKKINHEHLVCFNFLDKSNTDVNIKQMQNETKDKNVYKFDISQIDILKEFTKSYKALLRILFLSVFNVSQNSKQQTKYVENNKEQQKLIQLAEQMGFDKLLIKKIIQQIKNNYDENNFISLLLQNQNKQQDQQNQYILTPIEVKQQEQQIQDKQNKIKEKLAQNLHSFVNYTFINCLQYKELYDILTHFWSKYQKDIKKQKPFLKILQNSTQYSIKLLTGLSSKKKYKGKWQIIVSKQQDSLFYLLKLQNEIQKLINQIEYKNQSDQIDQKTQQYITFLINLLDNLIKKNNKLKRLQDSIYTIIEIICQVNIQKKDKKLLFQSLQSIFLENKKKINQKQKVYLINEQILISILKLINKIIYQDEEFIKELIYDKNNNLIKEILNVNLIEHSQSNYPKIIQQFRQLIESIIRRKQTLQLLLQSEITNLLQNNKKIELASFSNNFQKYIQNCEELFLHVFKKTCIIEKQNDQQYVTLKKDSQIPIKNFETKNYIKEFVIILIKNLSQKYSKKQQNTKQNYYFNDLILSDFIFLQILPRYPFLYLIKNQKKKSLFTVSLFEKFIKLHWGYTTFFEPLVYDSHFLVEDEQNQIMPVNYLILNKIFLSIQKILENIKQELIETKELNLLVFSNISIFLLNILNASHIFEKYQKQFIENLQLIEQIALIQLQQDNLQMKFQNLLLSVSVIMRRIQILKKMNQKNIIAVEQQQQNQVLIIYPRTFAYNLNEWTEKKEKNFMRDYTITYSNKSHINYDEFLTKQLSQENNLSKILNKLKRFQYMDRNSEPPIRFRGIMNRGINEDQESFQSIGNTRNIPNNRTHVQEINLLQRQNQEIQDFEEFVLHNNQQRRGIWEEVNRLEEIEQEESIDIQRLDESDNDNQENFDEDEEEDEEDEEHILSENWEEEELNFNQFDQDDIPEQEVIELYDNSDQFNEEENYSSSLEEQEIQEIIDQNAQDINQDQQNYDQQIDQEMYYESSQDDSFYAENFSESQEQNLSIEEEDYDDKLNKQDFFSQELYQNYPYIYPLNLTNKSFNFFYDKMNSDYQFYLSKYLLANCQSQQQKAYQICDKDFLNFDYKEWVPKKIKQSKNNFYRGFFQRRQNQNLLDFELVRLNNLQRNTPQRIMIQSNNPDQRLRDLLNQRILWRNNNDYELEDNLQIYDSQGLNRNLNQNNLFQMLTNQIDQQQDQQISTQNNQILQDRTQQNEIIQQNQDIQIQQNQQQQTQNQNEQQQIQPIQISSNQINQQQNIDTNQMQIEENVQQDIEQQVQEQSQNRNLQNQSQETLILQNIQQQIQQEQINLQQNQNQQDQQNQNLQDQNQENQNEQNQNEQDQNQENQNEQNQNQQDQNQENQNSRDFNFEALGVPNNFLEIAQIDPTFFYALPNDLQTEIVIEQGDALNIRRQPTQRQNQQENNNNESQQNIQNSEQQSELDNIIEQQNQNLIFLQSLAPDIREEVLLSCPDEFLQSLPQEYQQEANDLRANNIIQERYVQRNIQQQNQGNVLENRVKKNLKGQKITELLNKIYPVEVYPKSQNLLKILIDQLQEINYNVRYIPLSLMSCLLFDKQNQEIYYQKFIEIMESNIQDKIKIKFLKMTVQLSYANYQFFLDQINFAHLIEFLPKNKNNIQIIGNLLKIVANVAKRAVNIQENKENCTLIITERSLENLTEINQINTQEFQISDYLSIILMILSFNRENLKTIVSNLKDNISKFALNLNIHLKTIIETKKSSKHEYMQFVESIIMKNLTMYQRFSKLFRLIESLFSRSFKSNLQQEGQNSGKKNLDIEESKLLKVKEQVLKEFSNYFEDQSIKRVFNKVFKIVNFFEINFDDITDKKNFSKPTFYKMLSLIESFFILYKIQCDDEDFQSVKQRYNLKKNSEAKIADYTDQIKSEEDPSEKEFHIKEDINLQQMFEEICKKNIKVLNFLMKKIPKLTDSPLKIIIKKMPKLVDFQLKRKYFIQKIQSLKIKTSLLSLKIRREMLFTDSFTQLVNKKPIELRQKLFIQFQNEEGQDAGGLTREWFQLLSKEIFNPNYALFIPAAHGYAYQPSPYSSINSEHLKYFQFIGRIVGKTLFDGQLLDAHFTRSFYKHMVGSSLNYFDIEDYDPEYFKTLKWILENDVTVLDLTFSYETNHFGKIISKNLKENGDQILVDNQNKKEYIRLLCYAKMANEIKPQIQAFLQGLHDIIPQEMIQMFTAKELELMISGLPQIDILDLKKNTIYVNYTKDDLVIQNFWKLMNDYDESQRAGFLQYVTGTSKVPLEGFAELKGIGGGVQKFQIHKAFDTNKLPTSHTCMNQLDLPNYESYEELKQKLTIAITYGKEGFGFL